MDKTIGYVIHDHPDVTSEGFGSHARGVLFPLLHVALVNQLQPIVWRHAYSLNTARNYSDLKVAAFLGVSEDMPLNNVKVIEINTWSDPVVGSACGDASVLADLIHEYLKEFDTDERSALMIRLVGALRYMNPTERVWRWLQRCSQEWKRNSDQSSKRMRIAAHVRVPEHFCPQSWKDDNHVSKLCHALENFLKASGLLMEECELAVYTEARFSLDDERLVRSQYQQARIHRGTSKSLLGDLEAMATADIFIPSSSYFSAIAGYLSHGLILLSDSSRWEYFKPHFDLGCHIIESNDTFGKLSAQITSARDNPTQAEKTDEVVFAVALTRNAREVDCLSKEIDN
jgi:hypothetical protein